MKFGGLTRKGDRQASKRKKGERCSAWSGNSGNRPMRSVDQSQTAPAAQGLERCERACFRHGYITRCGGHCTQVSQRPLRKLRAVAEILCGVVHTIPSLDRTVFPRTDCASAKSG